jgi:hypothetical protein
LNQAASFTLSLPAGRILATMPGCIPAMGEGAMIWLALAMFVSLFAWGANYFGWDDPEGKVRLALFTCFVLGALCGYKSKG